MRNREFLLALAIVGAAAFTVSAGDGRSIEDRVAAIEAQLGPDEHTGRPVMTRLREIERQLAGGEAPPAEEAPPARPLTVADLEDPRKLKEPEAGVPALRFVIWLTAYQKAVSKQLVVTTLEKRLPKAGVVEAEIIGRDLAAAREDLAALIAETERARKGFRAAPAK